VCGLLPAHPISTNAPRHRECPHGLLVAVFFARTSARTSTAGGATGILVLPDPNSIPLGDGYFCVMVITAGAPGVAHDRTIHTGPRSARLPMGADNDRFDQRGC
jgi:hypothetical protein